MNLKQEILRHPYKRTLGDDAHVALSNRTKDSMTMNFLIEKRPSFPNKRERSLTRIDWGLVARQSKCIMVAGYQDRHHIP
jgi:hypothetical protein